MRAFGSFAPVVVSCLALAGTSVAQSTVRASLGNGGVEGNGFSSLAAVSADGRYVAFVSSANNLVLGDTYGFTDVFVRDLVTGVTERASVGFGGVEADSSSGDGLGISADGRFIVFSSDATDLDQNDTNGTTDIFVRDTLAHTTTRVSVDAAGAQVNGTSFKPSISADGRYVAFVSDAPDLVLGDANGVQDVFVKDRQTGIVTRVSVGDVGQEGNDHAILASIAPSGSFVAFASLATNLVSGDTNGFVDVFVRDVQNATTWRASVGPGGIEADIDSGDFVSVSADGRFVVFDSDATNLVANDTNNWRDIFLNDHTTGLTERVNVAPGGIQTDNDSTAPMISADGRFVAFQTKSTVFASPDTNNALDIFVKDRVFDTTTRASVDTSGTGGNARSFNPVLTGDGRFVVFGSNSSNLVGNDTNGVPDVFLRDRGLPGGGGYCFGDGTGTACPCGNASAPGSGAGCMNSLGTSGRLAATGSASISSDTLVLHGSGMSNSSALYFQGSASTSGGAGAVFGDGLRCASGTVVRLGTKLNAGGASQYPGAGNASISVKGMCAAGNTRDYQAWYRNAGAFCTPSTFNLTNGVLVQWLP
jgi:Tol biopolymer transport system component